MNAMSAKFFRFKLVFRNFVKMFDKMSKNARQFVESSTTLNLGEVATSGFDIVADYSMDTAMGPLSIRSNMSKFLIQLYPFSNRQVKI